MTSSVNGTGRGRKPFYRRVITYAVGAPVLLFIVAAIVFSAVRGQSTYLHQQGSAASQQAAAADNGKAIPSADTGGGSPSTSTPTPTPLPTGIPAAISQAQHQYATSMACAILARAWYENTAKPVVHKMFADVSLTRLAADKSQIATANTTGLQADVNQLNADLVTAEHLPATDPACLGPVQTYFRAAIAQYILGAQQLKLRPPNYAAAKANFQQGDRIAMHQGVVWVTNTYAQYKRTLGIMG